MQTDDVLRDDIFYNIKTINSVKLLRKVEMF